MSTLEQKLNESQTNLQTIADEINQLEQKKQELLQELFRLQGEIRILTKLVKEQNVSENK